MSIPSPVLNGGSSPRSWGTSAQLLIYIYNIRFIPTLVGNVSRDPLKFVIYSVHPHARGERIFGSCRAFESCGSSPRSWGTSIRAFFFQAIPRFIPTLVGNVLPEFIYYPSSTVHPHARGERLSPGRIKPSGLGSSPRSWGTFKISSLVFIVIRFIPTLMGNVPNNLFQFNFKTVHPHARGERLKRPVEVCYLLGSSPRSWGTSQELPKITDAQRFIPTLVGNVILKYDCEDVYAVHPHARGERFMAIQFLGKDIGSSPRSWGTSSKAKEKRVTLRFIPTLVGNVALAALAAA